MFAELPTDISEVWLITIRTCNSGLQVITKDGSGHATIKLQHGVYTVCKIGCLLRVNRITENETTKGQDDYKHLAGDPLTGTEINIMLLLTGKIDHDHICSLVLQVHRQIPIFQVLIKVVTVMTVYISVRVLGDILLPKQLTRNTGFTEFTLRIPKVIDQLLQPACVMRYAIIAISFVGERFVIRLLPAACSGCLQQRKVFAHAVAADTCPAGHLAYTNPIFLKL